MKHMTKIPIEKATTPFNGAEVLTNRWWSVLDGCIFIYRDVSPQCNSQKEISEMLTKKLFPGGESVFLPVVYIKRRDILE